METIANEKDTLKKWGDEGKASERVPLVASPFSHMSVVDLDPNSSIVPSPQYVRALDNLRTVLVACIIVQRAILETVSRVQGDAEALYPRQYRVLDLFVGVGSHLAIGILFFISGHGSAFSMRSRTPLQFAARKTVRTAILVLGGCVASALIDHVYGPWKQSSGAATSYYALRTGKLALLHGPIFYLFLLLAFDYFYALLMTVTIFTPLENTRPYFTSMMHYSLSKYVAMLSLQAWTSFVAGGSLRPLTFLSPFIDIIRPGPHVPIQYAIAYIAGVQFSNFAPYLATENPPTIGPLLLTLSTRLWVSTTILFSLRRRFPEVAVRFMSLKMPQYLSVDTSLPPTAGHQDYFVAIYGIWSSSSFILLSTPILQLFVTTARLKKDWGLISKATRVQPFIHMFFVLALSPCAACIDNLILRSLVVAVGSILAGWAGSSVLIAGWEALDKF